MADGPPVDNPYISRVERRISWNEDKVRGGQIKREKSRSQREERRDATNLRPVLSLDPELMLKSDSISLSRKIRESLLELGAEGVEGRSSSVDWREGEETELLHFGDKDFRESWILEGGEEAKSRNDGTGINIIRVKSAQSMQKKNQFD